MRFLVDNALSPKLAKSLNAMGHDAVHVRERGLHSATDDQLLDLAESERRVVLSADTDFGTLLAQRGGTAPSVILFRRGSERRPEQQTKLLAANLEFVAADLKVGAVVIFGQERVRVRSLPILPR